MVSSAGSFAKYEVTSLYVKMSPMTAYVVVAARTPTWYGVLYPWTSYPSRCAAACATRKNGSCRRATPDVYLSKMCPVPGKLLNP